jgi:hypothetical protein
MIIAPVISPWLLSWSVGRLEFTCGKDRTVRFGPWQPGSCNPEIEDRKMYHWELFLRGGIRLHCTSEHGHVSSWFLFWSNGWLRRLGREIYDQLQFTLFLGIREE